LEEIKHDPARKFLTLTFTEENLIKLENETGNNPNNYSRYNAVATLAVRRFLERWRKKYKKSVKHSLFFCFIHSIHFPQPTGTYLVLSSETGGITPPFFLLAVYFLL